MSAVAVILTCHDLGRTLGEALASVSAQSRPAAEIVVVDDGSTDVFTRQVLASIAAPRTRVERLPHRGVAAARDHGVRLTRAPYVVLLDADDRLEPGYLAAAAARLDAEPSVHIVSCAMREHGTDYTWTPPPPTLANTLGRQPIHVSSMFRREVWEAVGGFDPTLAAYEDTDFWAAALARGFRAIVLDAPLLVYRRRAGSRSHRAFAPAVHVPAMLTIHAKHRAAVEALGLEILLARETTVAEQRDWQRALRARARALEAEAAGLRETIADAARALRALGAEPVDWGDLGRLGPFSPLWGLERGRPLDRLYIERFLARHAGDVRGRVLEIKDAGYTERFGGDRVTESHVLDVDPANPRATLVADLARGDAIPPEHFDCFILTQTLHIIYDVRAAVRYAARALAPGGVLLATLPAVSRINFENGGLDGGDYWRFTEASVRALFGEAFPPEAFSVEVAGNVRVCAAFLYGLAPEELDEATLAHVDPWFPLLYCVRAVKPAPPAPSRVARCLRSGGAGLVLAYHRVGSRAAGLEVSPEDFRAQMEHLARARRPMPLEELVRAAEAGSLPERAVAVTLDDGDVDALETASPILAALGIPATFFVVSEALDAPREFWWDTLDRIFLASAPLPATLALALGGATARLATDRPEARARARAAIAEHLVRADACTRDALVRDLLAWSGVEPEAPAGRRALTAAEVRTLAARPGHTIGSHTARHLYLPAQPLAVRIREILDGKVELERALGRAVTTFAYPYGGADATTREVVSAAGFTVAVTTEPVAVRAGVDLLGVPRVEVPAAAAPTFGEFLEARLAATAE
jgi:peptidoglycan/xylan/chitin deacetylase (PgdA/CDA1 family)/GT2 family glycosyltransferase/SAM-dependent methyltransferase